MMMECCEEDEPFLADWIFDESSCGTTEKCGIIERSSCKDEVTLTPPEVVRRVYGLGRAIAEVFREFALHFWTSGGTTLGAVRPVSTKTLSESVCVLQGGSCGLTPRSG